MAALRRKIREIAEALNRKNGGADFRGMNAELFCAAAESLPGLSPIAAGDTSGNPVQVLDFFSGAGGASLGFAAINAAAPVFSFLAGCDADPVSSKTYSANFGTPLVCENLLKIAESPSSIRAYLESVGFSHGKPSVLIGCPPCQGFSSHRKKRWAGEDDGRNNLALAFSRIVAEAGPDVVIMENVPEFLSKKYWQYFSGVRSALAGAGYTVKQNVYNSAEFGVPQERFRSIVVGMKKNFLLPKGRLRHAEYRTVRDAISDLPPLEAGESCPNDALHRAVAHKPATLDVIKKVPRDGGSLPKGEGPKCLTKVNGFYDVYGRLAWDRPSITITHYARNPASGRFTHPAQDRALTAREAARLQSFPDGFLFHGKSDGIYRQIGEAVPPLLSCGIAVDMLIEYLSPEPTSAQLEGESGIIELPVSSSFSSVIAGFKKTRRLP